MAAANPIFGRYDNSRSFNDNVDLTEPILSRFDILVVIKDEVDYQKDQRLASFVINSHIKSHPDIKYPINPENEEEEKMVEEILGGLIQETEDTLVKKDVLTQEQLKNYILYARKYVHPKINDLDKEKLSEFYADIRRISNVVGGNQIGVRHIESMLRMSEAHAKMHLRDYVRTDDLNLAIKMMLESFLMSQKSSVASALRPKFAKYTTKAEDEFELLLHMLRKMSKEKGRYLKSLNRIALDQAIEVEVST